MINHTKYLFCATLRPIHQEVLPQGGPYDTRLFTLCLICILIRKVFLRRVQGYQKVTNTYYVCVNIVNHETIIIIRDDGGKSTAAVYYNIQLRGVGTLYHYLLVDDDLIITYIPGIINSHQQHPTYLQILMIIFYLSKVIILRTKQ